MSTEKKRKGAEVAPRSPSAKPEEQGKLRVTADGFDKSCPNRKALYQVKERSTPREDLRALLEIHQAATGFLELFKLRHGPGGGSSDKRRKQLHRTKTGSSALARAQSRPEDARTGGTGVASPINNRASGPSGSIDESRADGPDSAHGPTRPPNGSGWRQKDHNEDSGAMEHAAFGPPLRKI